MGFALGSGVGYVLAVQVVTEGQRLSLIHICGADGPRIIAEDEVERIHIGHASGAQRVGNALHHDGAAGVQHAHRGERHGIQKHLARPTDGGDGIAESRGVEPVSYTHLDVYKRQAHTRPPGLHRTGTLSARR